jgi:shikimate kinase
MALKRRHVVLVGLPGAGKSSAGRLAAERLGAPFADFDAVIEARAGKPVPRIFAEDGEAAFRSLEAEVGKSLLDGEPSVLAPGGGWFLNDTGRRSALGKGLVIYLRTSPAEAARRLTGEPSRPLLAGFEPVTRLGELLGSREAIYLEAHQRLTTDSLSVEEVAEGIAKLARTEGGW